MEIVLANPRGFCAGVDRAIEIVERALDAFGAPIYVRHEVVHNRFVVESLRRRGAIFVDELQEVPDGNTVIFSAHGVSQAVRRESDERDLKVFDATCPLVTKVHLEVARHLGAAWYIPTLFVPVLLLVFIAWRAFSTPQWIFNVKARTGIVELVTPSDGETRWRVNGSVICTRGALQPDSEPLSGARLTDTTCGSAAWTGYRFRDPEQTLVLNGSFRVLLEIRRDGSLFLSLRDYKPEGRQDQAGAAKPPPQAILTFTDGTPDIALGRNGRTRINFLWSGGLEPESGQPDDRVADPRDAAEHGESGRHEDDAPHGHGRAPAPASTYEG